MSALFILVVCFFIGRFLPSIAGLALIIGTAVAGELLVGNGWAQLALLAISICSLMFAHRFSLLMQWREGMRLAGYHFGLLAMGRWGMEGWQAALPMAFVAAMLLGLTQLSRYRI